MKGRSLFAATLDWRLEAVYEDPSDDRARARYARWAREQGLPHGEFVELQMAAMERALTSKESAREAELLDAHGREWLGGLADVAKHVRFRRGFPASITISAGRDSDLKALVGNPAYATVESVEFEHVLAGRCRRTGCSQVGIAHPVFRALRSVSGIYGAPILAACRVHRQLEAIALFVPPESSASMAPAPPPEVVARAVAELPALRCVRVGNDAVTTSDEVDERIARILIGGRKRPLRVSIVADHRLRSWLGRMKKLPAGELELRSDGCGTMSHPGMALSVRIADRAVQPRARAVFTPAVLDPERHEMRAFFGALPILARAGLELVEVTVPDPTRNGPLLQRAALNAGRSLPTLDIRH